MTVGWKRNQLRKKTLTNRRIETIILNPGESSWNSYLLPCGIEALASQSRTVGSGSAWLCCWEKKEDFFFFDKTPGRISTLETWFWAQNWFMAKMTLKSRGHILCATQTLNTSILSWENTLKIIINLPPPAKPSQFVGLFFSAADNLTLQALH